MLTWRSMVSAPQDGRPIRVQQGDYGWVIARWDWGDEDWIIDIAPMNGDKFRVIYAKPTAWMPL